MKSKEIGDVYATREPGEAFHDRIRACLALHDESVKVSFILYYWKLY
jgi:26S proteasome regulatory subunit N3